MMPESKFPKKLPKDMLLWLQAREPSDPDCKFVVALDEKTVVVTDAQGWILKVLEEGEEAEAGSVPIPGMGETISRGI